MRQPPCRARWLIVSLGLWGPSLALAGTLAAPLSDAQAALDAGQPAAALAALKGAEDVAASASAVADPTELAQVFLLRGISRRALDGRTDAAMDLWRAAVTIDPAVAWDDARGAGRDDHAVFEALRDEARARKLVSLGLPEATGAAVLYLDGRRVVAGDEGHRGRHLAQVTCDDGTTHGQWFDTRRTPRWLKLCPGGVDTSVVVAAAPVEDDWAEFGPSFGEPAPVQEPAQPQAQAAPAQESAPATRQGMSKGSVALVASGGALLASGVVLNFVALAPAWRAVETAQADPGSLDRATADATTQRFNSWRAATLGVGVVGIGLLGGGLAVHLGSSNLALTPTGAVLRGQF